MVRVTTTSCGIPQSKLKLTSTIVVLYFEQLLFRCFVYPRRSKFRGRFVIVSNYDPPVRT